MDHRYHPSLEQQHAPPYAYSFYVFGLLSASSPQRTHSHRHHLLALSNLLERFWSLFWQKMLMLLEGYWSGWRYLKVRLLGMRLWALAFATVVASLWAGIVKQLQIK
jgi:hypothetical protein